MRNVIFYDTKITEKEFLNVWTEYAEFHKQTSGLTVTHDLIPFDFSTYPTYTDGDGDERPTVSFLRQLTDRVTKEYGEYGTDNVKLIIHQDNWRSDPVGPTGIWGTAWSYVFGTFHVQYCRWDKSNPANSFGTINHEDDHSFDALIKVELGVDINPILGVTNYDKMTTHGGRPDATGTAYHGYIRYKENAGKLKVLSPYLKRAYAKRLERHNATHMGKVTGLQKGIIGLLTKLKYQLAMNQNKKDGVSIK